MLKKIIFAAGLFVGPSSFAMTKMSNEFFRTRQLGALTVVPMEEFVQFSTAPAGVVVPWSEDRGTALVERNGERALLIRDHLFQSITDQELLALADDTCQEQCIGPAVAGAITGVISGGVGGGEIGGLFGALGGPGGAAAGAAGGAVIGMGLGGIAGFMGGFEGCSIAIKCEEKFSIHSPEGGTN